jgi:hypothetical protein
MFGTTGSRAGRKRSIPQVIPAAPTFDQLAPTTTRGDLIARGVATNQRLAIGTAGQVLGSNGTDPLWTSTWATILSTADESRTSNVTLANAANLAGFSVLANTRYAWRGALIFGPIGTSGGGYRYTFTGPASPTAVMFASNGIRLGGATDILTASAFGTALSEASNIDGNIIPLWGWLQNGANAGTVQLQWAQNSSSPTSTTLFQGSYIEWMQV